MLKHWELFLQRSTPFFMKNNPTAALATPHFLKSLVVNAHCVFDAGQKVKASMVTCFLLCGLFLAIQA